MENWIMIDLSIICLRNGFDHKGAFRLDAKQREAKVGRFIGYF